MSTSPRRPTPSAAPALLVVAGGSAGALLVLFLLARLADWSGHGVPGLVEALDPASSGSLPELLGEGWLATAALVALVAGSRAGEPALLRLALLPMMLALVETSDLAARLEPVIGGFLGMISGTPGCKLMAAGCASGLILITAMSAACGRSATSLSGRTCLVSVLLVGSVSLACDLIASLAKGSTIGVPWTRTLGTLEEAAELGLYTFIASIVLGAAIEAAFPKIVPIWEDLRPKLA